MGRFYLKTSSYILHYRINILIILFLSFATSIYSRYRVITLEDVLEELLQEEIYDENDQMEKEAEKIALWVGKKWRLKRRREQEAAGERVSIASGRLSMASIVVDAMNSSQKDNSFNATNESTSLLQKNEGNRRNGSGLLGSIFQSLGMNKDDSS
jgi:hypothetical protein